MRKTLSITVLLALLFSLIVGVVYSQRIVDQFSFWGFTPSESIARLSERGGLSDKGQFYFYVAKPALVGADAFNESCQREDYSSPILGCYRQGDDEIYIYDINNPDLDGIEEVTAAHEMFHVVFSRMSESEKQRIAPLLESAYERLATSELEQRMAQYAESEPGSRINELHSIIPTEFGDIGEELESYYAQYFDDRSKTIALHDNYRSVFTSLEQQASQLEASLKRDKARIDRMEADYQASLDSLNRQIADFNQRANSGDFTSQQQFNSQRADLVSRSERLEQQRQSIIRAIDSYNQDVEQLNALGGQMQQLNQSLDSLEAVN